MPRLLLFRHAKSSWDDASLPDIARPLNARGRRAAPLIGQYLEEQRLFPDRILCSSSQRTRETLAAVLPFLRKPCEITVTETLYRDSEDSYLPLIKALGGEARTLMTIGHNPATQETAMDVVGSGAAADKIAMTQKFPTAALAVFDFEHGPWSEVEPASGRLAAFVRPRDLDEF